MWVDRGTNWIRVICFGLCLFLTVTLKTQLATIVVVVYSFCVTCQKLLLEGLGHVCGCRGGNVCVRIVLQAWNRGVVVVEGWYRSWQSVDVLYWIQMIV